MRAVRPDDVDGEHPFYLCLTHDVDRVYKRFQGPYYAVKRGDLGQLRYLVDGTNPYWQFDTIMAMEEDLGVRSSFNFLDEQHLLRDLPPRRWLGPRNWWLFLGRYDVTSPDVAETIRRLAAGGWEIGLHGSYDSYDDPSRLESERDRLEGVLGRSVLGGRQHHLNLDRPRTWEHQRAIGLRYDATLGSSTRFGFEHGYAPLQPFDDAFTVFPMTVMERPLMAGSTVEEAMVDAEALLEEARANGAVMTILWHQRVFDDREFPGHGEVYRRIVERALEMGGWVGPCGELYRRLVDDADAE